MALRSLAAAASGKTLRQHIRGIQTFTLPDLAYDYGALEPAISGEIMQIHHQKHHQTYITNYNKALEQLDDAIAKADASAAVKLQSAIKFNGGGHVNHSIFWKNLAPIQEGGGEPPHGSLGWAIDQHFGSMEKLIAKMNAEGAAVQGSGPCSDEIRFDVYMNDDAMDHVVFALAKKKVVKGMQKEERDLQRFGSLISSGPSGRKWVADELMVLSESKEVAGDLINETVIDQVFGEKAYKKFGKWLISMHFSDQQQSSHRKMLVFKFALPDANHMADMTPLVALVPYYIDLIGRYKLSSQARSKTEAARSKAAQEVYKELQNARQEALQRKKTERRKMMEEAESKLNAEAVRRKEAKERARQLKKAMPKIKMSRGG